MTLTLNYIVTVIAVLALSCDTNTITQKPYRNTSAATKNSQYLIEVFLASKDLP